MPQSGHEPKIRTGSSLGGGGYMQAASQSSQLHASSSPSLEGTALLQKNVELFIGVGCFLSPFAGTSVKLMPNGAWPPSLVGLPIALSNLSGLQLKSSQIAAMAG